MERILNSPEILEKVEKGLAQLSTALRTFSKACGLLLVESGVMLPFPPREDRKLSRMS